MGIPRQDVGSRARLRTYEEVEKRRSLVMAGRSPESGSAYLLVFLASTALTAYLMAAPVLGFGQADLPSTGVTAAVGSLSFFGYRLSRYRGRKGGRARRLALRDAGAFAGGVALAAWTFVFPSLYKVPFETEVVGVYSLIIIIVMVLFLGFFQPGLKAQKDNVYMDIESSLKQLGEAVEQLKTRVPQGQKPADPAVAERLTTMMSEVTAMKVEFASLRATVSQPASRQVGVVTGVAPSRPPPSAVPVVVPETKAVVRPQSSPPSLSYASRTGPATPDSAVDNPWLDVLSGRKRKKGSLPSGKGQ